MSDKENNKWSVQDFAERYDAQPNASERFDGEVRMLGLFLKQYGFSDAEINKIKENQTVSKGLIEFKNTFSRVSRFEITLGKSILPVVFGFKPEEFKAKISALASQPEATVTFNEKALDNFLKSLAEEAGEFKG